MANFLHNKLLLIASLLIYCNCTAQISPGDLSNAHAHLEGISNCTQCHIVGKKLSNDKCLDCHKELNDRLVQNKGYHNSIELKGKLCINCHSEHHGRNFQIVRFDESKFKHALTGFNLIGTHAKKLCKDCHKIANIKSPKIAAKKYTYLGLKPECNYCHLDYHQNTLDPNCSSCHNQNSFKPASEFNHNRAKYSLTGKHKELSCTLCHKTEIKNGVSFQKFKGLQFGSCVDCHTDVHKNQFGQNCMQCHSGESFTISKSIKNFDHSKTKFQLTDKHLSVDCKLCHKARFTDPLKHAMCSDCHKDFHKGQFVIEKAKVDCSSCHDIKGFQNSLYTIEQHNKSSFSLTGAHLALACIECHKKTVSWSFRNIGTKCIDCHTNKHEGFINKKYFPEDNCLNCHNEKRWDDINFDHSKTDFKLLGVHVNTDCIKCHFKENPEGIIQQKFAGLSKNCSSCHNDKHNNQFDKNGITDCNICHEVENWKPSKFLHENSGFSLKGKHSNLSCSKCHKASIGNQNNFIQYKIKTNCESCHS